MRVHTRAYVYVMKGDRNILHFWSVHCINGKSDVLIEIENFEWIHFSEQYNYFSGIIFVICTFNIL